jgi:hypothetical protein
MEKRRQVFDQGKKHRNDTQLSGANQIKDVLVQCVCVRGERLSANAFALWLNELHCRKYVIAPSILDSWRSGGRQ